MVMHYESGRSLQEHVVRNRSKEQKDVLTDASSAACSPR